MSFTRNIQLELQRYFQDLTFLLRKDNLAFAKNSLKKTEQIIRKY